MYYLQIVINLLIALIISFVIGEERSNSGKAIGFRSIALVMIGAFAFTIASCNIDNNVIDYHVIAQIVTGISFVGAGLIFKDNSVHNLTTAISVWTCAAIGILLGLNRILEALLIAAVVFCILSYKKKKNYEN